MAVPGPKIEVGPVAIAATAARKSPAEAGEEVRVPRTPAVPAIAEPKPVPMPREDTRELAARIAERLQQFLKDSGRDVEYRVDADAGATVITVRRVRFRRSGASVPERGSAGLAQALNEQSGTFVDALA